MLKKSILISMLAFSLNAATQQEEMTQMKAQMQMQMRELQKSKQDFFNYKKNVDKSFRDYKAKIDAEFKQYKKELGKYWEKPELSTKKEWVSYSKDKKSRSIVDFSKKTLEVEVIAKNQKQAQKELEKRVAYAISKNTKEVVKTDTLQRKIAKISRNSSGVYSGVNAKPILATLFFKKEPTARDAKIVSNKLIKKSKIKKQHSKVANENIYKITIKLPKNSTLKRSEVYKYEVFHNARRFHLPTELVFAIIQTESDFNPFAKSFIPAFGLMQIVPSSAGRDAYKLIYKQDKKPTATYLYNSKNNIEMGSSYLYLLYYRYLRKIKNHKSRLYCAIAAYNTGAGNIAWAFTHKTNMNQAAPKINKLTPDEVYAKLLKDLKYDEPKNYLRRVSKRMKIYKKAYKL